MLFFFLSFFLSFADSGILNVYFASLMEDVVPNERSKRVHGREKSLDFSYHKWAHLGVPMLISAGDDSKLFAYSVKEFTRSAPHDRYPAPQRVPMHLVPNMVFNHTHFLLIQSSCQLDICRVHVKNDWVSENGSIGPSTTHLVTLAVCKAPRLIICSVISSSGMLFGYFDHLKPELFELKKSKGGKSAWIFKKRKLPAGLSFAHCMISSSNSS